MSFFPTYFNNAFIRKLRISKIKVFPGSAQLNSSQDLFCQIIAIFRIRLHFDFSWLRIANFNTTQTSNRRIVNTKENTNESATFFVCTTCRYSKTRERNELFRNELTRPFFSNEARLLNQILKTVHPKFDVVSIKKPHSDFKSTFLVDILTNKNANGKLGLYLFQCICSLL